MQFSQKLCSFWVGNYDLRPILCSFMVHLCRFMATSMQFLWYIYVDLGLLLCSFVVYLCSFKTPDMHFQTSLQHLLAQPTASPPPFIPRLCLQCQGTTSNTTGRFPLHILISCLQSQGTTSRTSSRKRAKKKQA